MFTLYKASAGSGKTSRLVVEYLALCLPQPEKFKHVLAVTFTNNATAEMKSRIVNTLSQLAFEPQITPESPIYHTYNQIVIKIADHLPEKVQNAFIQKQAKILLEKILYEYDRFSISTIDSFFQRILRAFALEFGLNAQFDLEIEMGEFFKETISVLLHRISKNNAALTERVLDLVKNMMFEKGKWKIEKEILKLLETIMDEEVFSPLKRLQESENKNFEDAKKKITLEKKRLENLLKSFTSKEDKRSEAYKILQEQLTEQVFFGKNLFQLALLFDLKIIMDEIKAQENRFFLAETNAKISEKLENDDVPFIYEKIGIQYTYFFIDEFQDTSKLQWNNIIPLIKNALSGVNKFNEKSKVFLFGDTKQAIYRFRNGDSDILQQLSKIEGYRNSVLSYAEQDRDYHVELLDTNFRSSKKVVEFNNAFFSYLTAENAPFYNVKDFYEDVKQKIKPNAEEGKVTILFQEEEDQHKFAEFVLPAVLETVAEVMQNGYTYKDIAILVSNNDLACKIGAFLIARNIPVISAESLQLSSSLEINVVIATLQYLISEENKLAKLAIVHYLTHHLNFSSGEYTQYIENEDLFQQLLEEFKIKIDRNKWGSLSLFTLLHEIFRTFSFCTENPFLMRLLDESETFVRKHNGTISLYLAWWEDKGRTIALSTPHGTDAITVSTIHKSKGLEYLVVILPYSRYSNFKTKPDIFVHDHVSGLEYDWVTLTKEQTPERYQEKYEEESKKTLIDQLNKIYVAHTRAGKELHIITEKASAKTGNYSKFLAAFCVQYAECEIRHAISGKWETDWKTDTKTLMPLRSFDFKSPKPDLLSYLAPIEITNEQQRGIFIHNFLSTLTVFPQNETEIAQIIQYVDDRYKEDMSRIFHNILNNKVLKPYWAQNVKVLNETSILLPSGNILRPDRVVFLEDGKIVVIDYKTGSPNDSHQEQIEQYCNAISDMGYKHVEGHVLYI